MALVPAAWGLNAVTIAPYMLRARFRNKTFENAQAIGLDRSKTGDVWCYGACMS